ncbi:unnamed protein product, partial [Mesorhabditis spiculigera]
MASEHASTSSTALEYVSILTGRRAAIDKETLGHGACQNVNDFQKLNRLGEGTYGVVYRVKQIHTGEILALKRVRNDDNRDGISEAALREITLLNRLRHDNIVELRGVAVARDVKSMFLVMEYCEQDLASMLDNLKIPFSEAQVKCIVLQILRGMAYLHKHHVLHRDLKVSNLLITSDGTLKIADFGLARTYGYDEHPMTPRVVTLWYRSPELLLGSRFQLPAVDMWAIGCILGELLLHRPLMPGKNELDQICKIIDLLGTPNEKIWPGFDELPDIKSFSLKNQPYNNLKRVFNNHTSACIDLLNSLFTFNPKSRISASASLEHVYFSEAPMACDISLMPSFPQQRSRKRPSMD